MEINPLEQNVGLNMVLLGKTGAGKSATGNTILGRKAFISKKSPKSVTQDVAVASGTVCGYPITVYDTPGFCDTELSEDKIRQKFQSVFQECESGPCVYLLVIKADRFTAEEQNTVKKIEKFLGQNRLQKTWILFTRGDELEDENMTIEDFIKDTEPLKKQIQKYEGRYHVLNNKKKPLDQVKILVGKLRNELNQLLSRGVNKLKEISGKSHKNLPRRKLVLLGKTGVGKSAAGNTILGETAFKSEHSFKSVTTECTKKCATVAGRNVSVVDTPGFFDTSMDLERLVTEIARSIHVSSPGPHAFLIVFPVNHRFTEQEQQIFEQIKTLFGEDVFKYSIILFTYGDLLGKSIEKLIKENNALRDLVKQCGDRYHVFNNKDTGDREQVSDLLQKIDTMVEENGGGHYTSEMFKEAIRFKQEQEETRQREERERQREIGEQEKKQREEELERERRKVWDEYESKMAELQSQRELKTGRSQNKDENTREEEKQKNESKIGEEEEKQKNDGNKGEDWKAWILRIWETIRRFLEFSSAKQKSD